MRKKTILCSAFALLCVAVVHADDATKAYVSVQQNGTKVDAVGTAAYDLSNSPTLEFDANGNAVITVGGNTIAQLPMSNGGEMVMDFSSTSDNTLSKTVGTSGYATLYSPFQLTVPSGGDVEVYAPTYSEESQSLKLTDATQVSAGAVIPAGTGLLLKNTGTIDFTFSDGAATTCSSALSGSALTIATPTVESGNTLYTLGHETSDNTKYGFFAYTGATVAAGKAYLVAPTLSPQAKAVWFSFDDIPTSVTAATSLEECSGEIFNLAGQRVSENAKGIIIVNGKKCINK